MTQSHRPLAAALWMSGAIASFTLLAIAGREISVALDTFEIMLYRSAIGLVLVLAGARLLGLWSQIRLRRVRLHLARNLAHFAGQNLWFYAIAVLPLAQVFALEFTSPIWGLLLAPLLLGERLRPRGMIAAAIGFAGILVVARPGAAPLSPGLIAAALCAVGFALSLLLTKRLTRTESLVSILVWLNVMQLGFSLVITGHDGQIRLPPWALAHWMGLIGVAGLTAHLCLTRALQLAPANLVMPMDFARLPVIVFVGMALYGEGIDPWILLGGALILLGNWINLAGPRKLPAPPVTGP